MNKEIELLKESLAVILCLQDILHPQHEYKAVQELRWKIELACLKHGRAREKGENHVGKE